MLDDDATAAEAAEAEEEARGLEVALLALAAGALLGLKGLSGREVAAGAARLEEELAREEKARWARVERAMRRDLLGGMALSTLDDLRAVMSEPTPDAARKALGKARETAGEALRAVLGDTRGFGRNMRRSAVRGYYAAAQRAKARSLVVGYEEAAKEAVVDLAKRGITAYSYKRKDGVTVNVPVDVGVRRAIHNAGKERQIDQTIQTAYATGQNLIEVNWTTNARESHRRWQGGIYQLKGSGRYPNYYRCCRPHDKVDGIKGFNCGHKVAIYREGAPRAFSDPLEGTGYDVAEVSRLTSRQARLENEVRKEKRVAEVLGANGLDAADARRRVRKRQAQLRELVSEHPEVLRRRAKRESIYEKAREEAGALGIVHLDAEGAARVRGSAQGRAASSAKARAEWQDRVLGDLTVNRGSQEKHVEGTDAYRRKVEKVRADGYVAPSRVTVSVEECERLVRERAGTGRPLTTWRGEWSKKEVCSTDDVIGYYVDKEGRESRTRYFIIHYGKSGTHIVPCKDQGALFDED